MVDFRSDWMLCCCRFAFAQLKHLLLTLRFRTASWVRPMSRFTRDARSMDSGQHDVGHEGVITGCDAFSLRSSIANPQGVTQSPLHQPLHLPQGNSLIKVNPNTTFQDSTPIP